MTARCRAERCGRPLRTEESKARGYGPKCWRKLHPTPPKRGLPGGAPPKKVGRPAAADQPIAGFPPLERDTTLLCEAVEAVIRTRLATVTQLQRKLRVGAGRAGRLLGQMQEHGVIGLYRKGGCPVLVDAASLPAVLDRIRAGGQP